MHGDIEMYKEEKRKEDSWWVGTEEEEVVVVVEGRGKGGRKGKREKGKKGREGWGGERRDKGEEEGVVGVLWEKIRVRVKRKEIKKLKLKNRCCIEC